MHMFARLLLVFLFSTPFSICASDFSPHEFPHWVQRNFLSVHKNGKIDHLFGANIRGNPRETMASIAKEINSRDSFICQSNVATNYLLEKSIDIKIGIDINENSDTYLDCVVVGGTWIDDYTGENIVFSKDDIADYKITLDHIVPLEEMWESGFYGRRIHDRQYAANESGNMAITNPLTKSEKGNKSIAEWSPKDNYSKCRYARYYSYYKKQNNLTYTQEEVSALREIHGMSYKDKNGESKECEIRALYSKGLFGWNEIKVKVR